MTKHAGSRSCWDPNQLGPLGSILGRKWTLTIIASLHDGPVRHGQLCRRLKPIARKVLHQSLDGLCADGLVEKIIGLDDYGNASVSYGLTPLGASLHTVLDAMQAWAEQHSPTGPATIASSTSNSLESADSLPFRSSEADRPGPPE